MAKNLQLTTIDLTGGAPEMNPHFWKIVTAAREMNRHVIDRCYLTILLVEGYEDDLPIVYSNPAFLKLTGYSTEEILGHNCRFLQGEGTDEAVVQTVHDALADGQPCQVTLKNYRKDGSEFWNDLQITPVFDTDGQLISFVGVQNDITERIESETAAQRNATRTQTILDTAADGIIGLDLEGKCTFCNSSALRLLGYQQSEDFIGQRLHDLIHHSHTDGSSHDTASCEIIRASKDSISIHVSDQVFWRKDTARSQSNTGSVR